MNIIAVTQARMGSSRLPGKVLKPIGNLSLLALHLTRLRDAKEVSRLIVATSLSFEDQAIKAEAQRLNAEVFCGSEEDVLDRFYLALKDAKPDYVVRLTADCPLIDGSLIDKVIKHTIQKNLDYCSNTLRTEYPDGQDIEVFKFTALKRAWSEATLPSEREHVTPYLWKNSTFMNGEKFVSDSFSEGYNFGHLRMTVDDPQDLEVIRKLVKDLGANKSWVEYASHLEAHNEIRSLNESTQRNEGYKKSIDKEV
jgi:spore coat polysaccharide biosynthesis protein SpsF